jgi:hypothetical protein
MQETNPNGKSSALAPLDKQSAVTEGKKPPVDSRNKGDTPPDDLPDIGEELRLYLHRIDALHATLSLLMVMMDAMERSEGQKLNLFLRAKCKPSEQAVENDEQEYQVPPEYLRECSILLPRHERYSFINMRQRHRARRGGESNRRRVWVGGRASA